jgi:hypothetical protein
MDGTGRDQDLLPDPRVADPPGDLELHLPLQHDDQFVGGVREVLPPPSGGSVQRSQPNPRLAQVAAICSRSMVPSWR